MRYRSLIRARCLTAMGAHSLVGINLLAQEPELQLGVAFGPAPAFGWPVLH